jgi:hypothetical protein
LRSMPTPQDGVNSFAAGCAPQNGPFTLSFLPGRSPDVFAAICQRLPVLSLFSVREAENELLGRHGAAVAYDSITLIAAGSLSRPAPWRVAGA